jgi:hypothetical protein
VQAGERVATGWAHGPVRATAGGRASAVTGGGGERALEREARSESVAGRGGAGASGMVKSMFFIGFPSSRRKLTVHLSV